MSIETYVEDLYKKQNMGVDESQKNLYSKKQYYELIHTVFKLIKNHPDYSMQEYRKALFDEFGIEKQMIDFVKNKELSAGVSLTYGTKNFQETVIYGNAREISADENGNLYSDVSPMQFDNIFDIASMTKPFLAMSCLQLATKAELNLNDEIVKYCPQFKNLKGVTIHQLLSFGVPLMTNGRVDRATSKKEAEELLFDIEVNQNFSGKNPYTDMGAMVLKYVVEVVSGQSYYDYVKENILEPAKMNDTHVVVPENKIDRLISSNYDVKYFKDGNFTRTMNPVGSVYDPKAIAIGASEGNLAGHAGLFSSLKDFEKLSRALMSGNIIEFEAFKQMIKNKTGKEVMVDDMLKYTNYLGYMCYSKNPLKSETELHHALSGLSFSSAGWTGANYTFDYLNQINFAFFGPKSHNRATFIDPSKREFVTENEYGKKTLVLPDGSEIVDATRFAWDKGQIINPATELVLAYKILEDVVGYKQDYVEENNINITR